MVLPVWVWSPLLLPKGRGPHLNLSSLWWQSFEEGCRALLFSVFRSKGYTRRTESREPLDLEAEADELQPN